MGREGADDLRDIDTAARLVATEVCGQQDEPVVAGGRIAHRSDKLCKQLRECGRLGRRVAFEWWNAHRELHGDCDGEFGRSSA